MCISDQIHLHFFSIISPTFFFYRYSSPPHSIFSFTFHSIISPLQSLTLLNCPWSLQLFSDLFHVGLSHYFYIFCCWIEWAVCLFCLSHGFGLCLIVEKNEETGMERVFESHVNARRWKIFYWGLCRRGLGILIFLVFLHY